MVIKQDDRKKLGPLGKLRCRMNCVLGPSKGMAKQGKQRCYVRQLTAHLKQQKPDYKPHIRELLRQYHGIEGTCKLLVILRLTRD